MAADRSALHLRIRQTEPTDPFDVRQAVLAVGVGTGMVVTVVSEGLSLVHALTPEWVRLIWIGSIVGLVAYVVVQRTLLRATWHTLINRLTSERTVLAGLLAIVLLTGVTAWFAPPNTSDSMGYHMSRVANWVQRQSVANYATPTLRQLYQPPWAEFAILQLQLLSGSDRFANFVQWFSMIGCVLGASLIAKLLGGSARAQILTAVFVGTLPMGVLQASSTQNDFVESFWLVAFSASVLIIWTKQGTANWRLYLLAGASLGLAACTKGTSYFFAAPFVLLLLATQVNNGRARLSALRLLLLSATAALLVNVGQYARNEALFGSPLGPITEEADGAGYQVSALLWTGIISNMVRNIGMQLGTPSGAVNDAIFDDISYLHERLGMWLGSPITSWPGSTFERSTVVLSTHESTAGNALAVLLLGGSLVLGVTGGVFGRERRMLCYVLAWGAGFVLYSAILRWQPWGSRLDLPWVVLGGPMVAVVLSRRPAARGWLGVSLVLVAASIPLILQRSESAGPRQTLAWTAVTAIGLLAVVFFGRAQHVRRRLGALAQTTRSRRGVAWQTLNLTLLAAALPWVMFNETRPLLGPQSVLTAPRQMQYFAVLPHLQGPYGWAAAVARQDGCARVALLLQHDNWDYPLWALLRSDGPAPTVKVQYLGVSNQSARLAEPVTPCAIIATDGRTQPRLAVDGQQFVQVTGHEAIESASAGVSVFLPESSTQSSSAPRL